MLPGITRAGLLATTDVDHLHQSVISNPVLSAVVSEVSWAL